ncbi:DCC1-like thiol-disulfide oxidoreductase family protein [Legionella micdadei]|uniref:Uncharacterized protein n=1 Tax=Legionella micdadei TaxID=451 RepID=A0A098GGG9_LEGMI|nr:DCC1-like thiol-disulfide oxidoreductase family protein [Legionella micdadei]ARG97822.1 DUF393 domain-containing protein [Legionella micdadei]ARG99861.1 DUF393 domain-containing protein [Legionella micdadei]KTD28532.1 hypothetical protein Lmic_1643 [Legionella micdadei]NSL19127.1 DUF393 domain-containing protein [Legionella micdadei]CEG60576.1 protein of unknown function [Legionella micdadei]
MRSRINGIFLQSTFGATRGSLAGTRRLFNVPTRYLSTNTPESAKEIESLPGNCIVYDGSCPVCSLAVKKLKRPDVETINARENPELVKKLKEKGYDLDKGMVVSGPQGEVHFGSEAIREMGRQTGGLSGWLLNSSWMKSVYPLMRAVRNSLIPESLAEKQAREEAEATNKSNKL